MFLAEYDYQVWRKELHDLQLKIDAFDLEFIERTIEVHDEELYASLKEDHDAARKELVESLEEHYRNQPRT